jgi:putative ATP-dependent endonuclease of the OLD family
MKLRKIRVKNFRCLVDVCVPISDTTVLVGENNSGKTALLDALRVALPYTAARKRAPFSEYDYHMFTKDDSPENSDGIEIELWFKEDNSGDWPVPVIQDLTEIIQTDPISGINSIGLKLWSKYDEIAKIINHKWEFININGQALGGKATNPINLTNFLKYVRCFYLSSLRDSSNEFSSRSQFWGSILRDLKITEEQQKYLSEELSKLNESLLKSDDRLDQVRNTLEKCQDVMCLGEGTRTSIQALPLKPWDLMSKAEVVIRNRGGEVDFPLSKHGQGVQSLAVLYLFQSYIDILLKPTFEPETEAILALEEPEAHLHPQAIRSLAINLKKLQSQKIITTHSPYFIQEIPFSDIRLLRQHGEQTKVLYIKKSFSANLPETSKIRDYCKNNSAKYDYDPVNSILKVTGKIEESEYRKLVVEYADNNDAILALKILKEESQLFLSEDELVDLDTYAKRIRGEVLFARAWLLCEGQSEYLLLRYFSELIGTPLDQKGITLIDFQNNGSPGAFVGLARVFDIPWLMICDNDQGGKDFIRQIQNRGVVEPEFSHFVRPLPAEETDLELFLIKNGFKHFYEKLLADRGIEFETDKKDPDYDRKLADIVQKDKTGICISMIERLRIAGVEKDIVPAFFQKAINDIVAMAV